MLRRRSGPRWVRCIALSGAVVACIVAGLLDGAVSAPSGPDLSRFIIATLHPGLIEETACGSVLLTIWAATRHRTIDLSEWVAYAVMIGVGFGAVEYALAYAGFAGELWGPSRAAPCTRCASR